MPEAGQSAEAAAAAPPTTVAEAAPSIPPGAAPMAEQPAGTGPSSSRPPVVRRGTSGSVGLVLAGRYRLEDRGSLPGSERGDAEPGGSSTWEGHDEQLDRPVLVRVVSGPHVEDAVDAARRAAGVDDPRLARILDLGHAVATDGSSLGWVVEERPGGERLSDLLARAPLDPARARAVVGEAALALERAGHSGLHHRRLLPSSVHVQGDDVVVTGLAVAAAAAGLDEVPADQANREDAVGLVSLLYAALTGLWPHGSLDVLGAAPRSSGTPVPVRTLAPRVPNDLDTLLGVTLGPFDDGPFSPRELAQQLAPWHHPHTAVELPAVREERLSGETPPPPTPGPTTGARGPGGRGAGGSRTARGGAARAGAARAGAARAGASGAAARASAGPGAGRPGAAGPAEPSPGATPPQVTRALPRGPASRGRSPQRSGELDPLLAAQGAPDADRPATPSPERRAGAWVAAALAVLVVLAAVVAWQQLPRLRGVLGIPPSASGQPVLPLDGSGAGEPAPSSAPPAEPVAITGVTSVDPLGDGSENDDRLGRITDGDPTTGWVSSTYSSADLGGLKAGVGVDLQLAPGSSVSEVELVVGGSDGTVEVRTTPDGTFEASTAVATAQVGDGAGGPVVVALPEPVETDHVLLWFTTLPSSPDGFVVQLFGVGVR